MFSSWVANSGGTRFHRAAPSDMSHCFTHEQLWSVKTIPVSAHWGTFVPFTYSYRVAAHPKIKRTLLSTSITQCATFLEFDISSMSDILTLANSTFCAKHCVLRLKTSWMWNYVSGRVVFVVSTDRSDFIFMVIQREQLYLFLILEPFTSHTCLFSYHFTRTPHTHTYTHTPRTHARTQVTKEDCSCNIRHWRELKVFFLCFIAGAFPEPLHMSFHMHTTTWTRRFIHGMEYSVTQSVESTGALVQDSKKWPQYLAASLGKVWSIHITALHSFSTGTCSDMCLLSTGTRLTVTRLFV